MPNAPTTSAAKTRADAKAAKAKTKRKAKAMAGTAVVLKSEWDGGVNPLRAFDTGPAGCLDFNSYSYVQRGSLRETSQETRQDCQYHQNYTVVICQVTP